MNIFKKIIAVSALSLAMLLPSAKIAAPAVQDKPCAAAVCVYEQEPVRDDIEIVAQLYDKAESTSKSSEKKEKKEFNPVRSLIIALVVSLIIAFIVVGSMKSKLKTVRRQSGASNYTVENSMKLEINTDTYLYNKIEKTARPKSDS